MHIKTLIKTAADDLLYMGLSAEALEQVKEPVEEDNRRSVAAWAICTSFFWIMSLLLSLQFPDFAACRAVYAGALGLSILTLLCARLFVERRPWLLTPAIYVFELSQLFAGIGIAVCQPDVRTVTMIAFAIIFPAAIIDSTAIDILIHAIIISAYAILARGVIEPEIYSWGLANLVIFSVAGLMVGHVINKARYQRYVYAESAKRLAEIQTRYAYHDQLTGLKNRRAYGEALKAIEENAPEDYCIVMGDLNGLKEANDTFGHDTGDALIVGAAECLTAAFEGIDGIFRIGGDEFCVIVPDRVERATECLRRLDGLTAAWKGPNIDRVSISCGVASNRDCPDVNDVVVQADHNMYLAKSDYYKSSGMDRRKR